MSIFGATAAFLAVLGARRVGSWAWAICLGALFWGAPSMAETRTLLITVLPAADAAIPADAVLEVELLDVSRADAPAIRVAAQQFRPKGWPALVELRYDGAAINPRLDYRVAARLVSGDRVALRTTRAYPVLTRGASDSVRVALENTGAPPAPKEPPLAGLLWQATEIGGRALIADDPPTLLFLEGGGFAMFGGCNRFRGKAEPANGRVSFPEPIAGTMKACPPPRMELEKAMLAALRSATGYQRAGPRLLLTNEAGVAVARFRAAPG